MRSAAIAGPSTNAQRPDQFAAGLGSAAQAAVDPAGVMNPGVLIEACPRWDLAILGRVESEGLSQTCWSAREMM